ncbi:CinA family nicotinamide mononucleotide deamidase-related protein [Terrimonas alba]|uniref:CinA family nicotinamide mononucleotide deamidase-related protein n=1 Tax=Terrimonas alba TaxID=3349636 RepID=UPI0035F33199
MPSTINASIITIGDELLIGQTIDTNSAFIAQELNKIGIWVRRRVAVGDVWDDIWQALDEEGKQSQIIIITGGLGPTADDITKPLLCKYFGGKMIVDENVLNHVKYLFEKVYRRPGPILERNLKQAEVPDVCTVLHNARGSAPGMWFAPQPAKGGELKNSDKKIFISLPGVPHEMKGLVTSEVIPRLLKEYTMPAVVHRTAFTAGLGESMIAELLLDFESSLPLHIKLAYLPSYGMVRLRLTSTGDNKEAVEKELTPYFEKIQLLVKDYLVTNEDEGLEIVIGKILKAQNKTLGTAESCTGGYIAHLITSIAGSSAYYKGTIVSYANDVKENMLGVKSDTLKMYGAVTEETVQEMVKGALTKLNVDYALATSGIMGPDGGTDEKPVGTVWIAAGNKEKIQTIKLNLRFDRKRNIEMTAVNALNFLRKFILTNG